MTKVSQEAVNAARTAFEKAYPYANNVAWTYAFLAALTAPPPHIRAIVVEECAAFVKDRAKLDISPLPAKEGEG